MKKLTKLLVCMLLPILMIAFFQVPAYANSTMAGNTIDQIVKSETNVDTGNLTTLGAQVIQIITTIAIIFAIAIALVLGIKYMIGSAEDKSDYKKSMIPYLIGAVIVFTAAAIVKAIYTFSKSADATLGGNS